MKQSELLRKQADMIDLAEKHGIDDWRKLIKIKFGGVCYQVADKELYSDQQYQFALGVVEGKPVFEGDELYTERGTKFIACDGFGMYGCSLNPPKPKTVMIELPINMATYYAELQNQDISVMREACRKALESIKQS